MIEFKMPSLGADMEDGKLVEWRRRPGDAIARGDIIAVVETQKGAIEIEVFDEGVLHETLVEPGAILPVGAVMARIRGVAETPAPRNAEATAPVQERRAEPASPPPAPTTIPRGARASPAARRLALERGISLTDVTGGGPGGTITYQDVAAHAASAAERPRTPEPTGMRLAIAAAMARSKREIPHYYLSHTLDIGAAQDWIAKENAQRTPAERFLIGVLYTKAVALAARKFPEFNGFHTDGVFHPSELVHVGVAVSIRSGGLAAPAIHNAADHSLGELMAKTRELVQRVRAGRFRSSEIADPTITVTSLGDRGVEAVWGVIYPPQVAIVGFGKTVIRPWATGSDIALRPTVCISLAADHRVSDGHRGGLFLESIGDLLSQPGAL